MKSGNLNFLEPSGSLQACNGTALPLPLLHNAAYVPPTCFDLYNVFIREVNTQTYEYSKFCKWCECTELKYNIANLNYCNMLKAQFGFVFPTLNTILFPIADKPVCQFLSSSYIFFISPCCLVGGHATVDRWITEYL